MKDGDIIIVQDRLCRVSFDPPMTRADQNRACALWSQWLKTPEAKGYDGYCQCEWCQRQREQGRQYVRDHLKEFA
jgi:hypothetical protein